MSVVIIIDLIVVNTVDTLRVKGLTLWFPRSTMDVCTVLRTVRSLGLETPGLRKY